MIRRGPPLRAWSRERREPQEEAERQRSLDDPGRWQVDGMAPMVTSVCTHDEGSRFFGQL